jgi:hypothetical protein
VIHAVARGKVVLTVAGGGQAAVGGLLVTGDASLITLATSQAFAGAATGFFNPTLSGLMPAVAGKQLQQESGEDRNRIWR